MMFLEKKDLSKEHLIFKDDLTDDQLEECVNVILKLAQAFPDHEVRKSINIHRRNGEYYCLEHNASHGMVPLKKKNGKRIFVLPIFIDINESIIVRIGQKNNLTIQFSKPSEKNFEIYDRTANETLKDRKLRKLFMKKKESVVARMADTANC